MPARSIRAVHLFTEGLASVSLFNKTQATGIPIKRDELELAGRSETPIMKSQRIRIGKSNYPAAGKGIIPKARRRDNVGSNFPPFAAE